MKKTLFALGSFAYFFTAGFFLFSGNAHAYIDPSATTYIVQAVAAAVKEAAIKTGVNRI